MARSEVVRRVAVLSYHSSPLRDPGAGDAGGMTIYVRRLAEAMTRRGVRTDLFTRAEGDAPRIVDIYPGVRVVSIDAGPRAELDKRGLLRHVDEFAAGIRAFAAGQRASYDVVHSHYWQSGLAGLEVARGWDVPLVHSHHTLGRVKNRFLAPGDVPEPASRLDGEAKVIGSADVLVASTDDEWQQLACLYGATHDNLKTLHPGVDHGIFSPGDRDAARRKLGFGDEAILLYVGRIQRLKGLDLALQALEQLIPALDRKPRLVVVGGPSGPGGAEELARLKTIARTAGIEDAVSFVGPRPHTELVDFYRAADTVVVCSHSESFGLAALEAQASGTPVVGTPVGGLSHIVLDGRSGFLVESRDPTEFAARLKTLLSDKDLRASFSSAAVENSKQFSWDRTANSLVDLYDCLVMERAPEACTC